VNDAIFLRINDFSVDTPWLHAPVAAYAKYGIALFAVLMVMAWWSARRTGLASMARALLVPVATLGAVIAQQLVVGLVSEPRPYVVHPGALVLIARTNDGSFPSDHACIVGAATAALFLAHRRLGWIALVGALLMAGARVYAGVHWPADVLAGLVFGGAMALLIEWVLARPMSALVSWLATTRMRPLLESGSARPGHAKQGALSRSG